MLRRGEQDLVPLVQFPKSESISHQVERLRGIVGEYDLLRPRSADELRHLFVSLLIGHRGLVAQCVDGAMDVGIFLFIEFPYRRDHLPRPLGSSGIVQVS